VLAITEAARLGVDSMTSLRADCETWVIDGINGHAPSRGARRPPRSISSPPDIGLAISAFGPSKS